MAKGKAANFAKLMDWAVANVDGMGVDQIDSFVRSIPGYEKMSVADLQKYIDRLQAGSQTPTTRSPVSVEQRVAGNTATGLRPDANIRAALQELDPQFAARIDSASPEEIMEAYRNAVNKAEGARKGRPRKSAPKQKAVDPDGDAVRGLLPGVPVGGVRGPGVPTPGPTGMIPAPLRGLPDNSPRGLIPAPLRGLPDAERRGLSVMGDRAFRPMDDVIDVPFERLSGPIPLRAPRRPGLPDGRPLPPNGPPRQMPEADGPQPGMARVADAAEDSSDFWKRTAAGAVALGGAIAAPFLFPEQDTTPPAKGSSTADLVNETRPAPKVAATPDVPQPTVLQGPPDYSAQARQLIARANEIQRQAGRQTPESIALIKQADALYAKAAEGRTAGTQPAIMPVEQQNAQTSAIQRDANQQVQANQGGDYRSQARRMMAELNIRSSQGNISQAEYSAVKRRIDELFALADQEDGERRGQIQGRGRLPGVPTGGPQIIGPTGGYRRRQTPSTT